MARDPNVADFRLVLDELISFYEAHSQLEVDESDAARMVMLHGLLAHTLSMVKAALVLIDQRKVAAATVLARVAFEHAVFAQWAHVDTEGLEGLAAKEVITYGKLFNGLRGHFDFPPEVAKFYEEKMKKPTDYPEEIDSFIDICKSFIEGDDLYVFYRILSGSVHPGNLTRREYTHQNPDTDEVSLVWNAQSSDPLPILHSLTFSALMVAWVYEDIRKDKPNMGFIHSLGERVGIVPQLTLNVKVNPTPPPIS